MTDRWLMKNISNCVEFESESFTNPALPTASSIRHDEVFKNTNTAQPNYRRTYSAKTHTTQPQHDTNSSISQSPTKNNVRRSTKREDDAHWGAHVIFNTRTPSNHHATLTTVPCRHPCGSSTDAVYVEPPGALCTPTDPRHWQGIDITTRSIPRKQKWSFLFPCVTLCHAQRPTSTREARTTRDT